MIWLQGPVLSDDICCFCCSGRCLCSCLFLFGIGVMLFHLHGSPVPSPYPWSPNAMSSLNYSSRCDPEIPRSFCYSGIAEQHQGIDWELVGNAESETPPQTSSVRSCIFLRSHGGLWVNFQICSMGFFSLLLYICYLYTCFMFSIGL